MNLVDDRGQEDPRPVVTVTVLAEDAAALLTDGFDGWRATDDYARGHPVLGPMVAELEALGWRWDVDAAEWRPPS